MYFACKNCVVRNDCLQTDDRGVDNILTLGRQTLRRLINAYFGHDGYRPTCFPHV